MVLPTLTWNLVGPVLIMSGAVLRGPGSQHNKQEVMFTLKNLINSSSYWQIDVQDVTGSFTEALVLKPRSGSAVPNMRIVCTANVTGGIPGLSSTEANRTRQDSNNNTPDTVTADQFLMGFSPDVSASPTWITGSWASDRPWGNSVRFSKYWTGYQFTLNSSIEQMYLFESQETLWVGFKGRRGNSSAGHVGIGAGPYVVAFDSGSGEQDRRVWTMTSAATAWGASIHASTNVGPFAHNTTANSTHTGVFIVSGGVANTQLPSGSTSRNDNYWELITKTHTTTPTPSADASDRGTNTTSEENLIGWPVMMYSQTSPVRLVGYLRQTYVIQDFPSMLPVATGVNNPTVIGFTWGPDSLSVSDIFFLSNT